jgi:hypothetical protein
VVRDSLLEGRTSAIEMNDGALLLERVFVRQLAPPPEIESIKGLVVVRGDAVVRDLIVRSPPAPDRSTFFGIVVQETAGGFDARRLGLYGGWAGVLGAASIALEDVTASAIVAEGIRFVGAGTRSMVRGYRAVDVGKGIAMVEGTEADLFDLDVSRADLAIEAVRATARISRLRATDIGSGVFAEKSSELTLEGAEILGSRGDGEGRAAIRADGGGAIADVAIIGGESGLWLGVVPLEIERVLIRNANVGILASDALELPHRGVRLVEVTSCVERFPSGVRETCRN